MCVVVIDGLEGEIVGSGCVSGAYSGCGVGSGVGKRVDEKRENVPWIGVMAAVPLRTMVYRRGQRPRCENRGRTHFIRFQEEENSLFPRQRRQRALDVFHGKTVNVDALHGGKVADRFPRGHVNPPLLAWTCIGEDPGFLEIEFRGRVGAGLVH